MTKSNSMILKSSNMILDKFRDCQ